MGEEVVEEEQIPNLINEESLETTITTADGSVDNAFTWPVLRFDVLPYKTYQFHKQFTKSSNPNNFLKGVKWSPDGSCFLTSSDDNTLRKFDLPDNVDSTQQYVADEEPTTCVFATTTRDHPIHLWDATSGQLRCTYRAYDAMDEITAAFSVAFNNSGTKVYGGYNKSIRVFDLHRPGRDFDQYSTTQGKKEGQSGIISAISFCPTHSGILATGSYNQTTAIYSEDNMELLYVLHGQEGGVTHVQFSKDGNYLYTGARKDPYILCWDIRKTVGIVYKLYRSSDSTNQRIFFDIEPSGQHLGTGGQDGQVHIYDLQTGQWVSSFQAASDTVNGFSFHPFHPMAATTSGHRRFGTLDECDDHNRLSCEENCASVWSIYSMSDAANLDYGNSNMETQPKDIQQDP
ncbi:hypothetical protein MKX01_015331 [Papaver californicum]|nr:hypothetical protein MKX01_015331 [Papaver californicum]